MKPLEQKIEGLLLYKNEPVSYSWLARVLEVEKDVIHESIKNMQSQYIDRGCILVTTGDSVAIMTSSIAADVISSLSKHQDERELSKQALETLSIILYKSRVTKSEIDYVRGVNSVFILRNLLIRGLIAKKPNIIDKRSPIYTPTHDLMSFLGIENVELLPEYEKIKEKLVGLEERFIEDQREINPLIVGNTK